MTSTTSLNHTIGLSYRDRIWCAWRYPSGKPDELRTFVGHSREKAVSKCCAGLPSGVADAFGRLVVDTAGAPQRAIKDKTPVQWRPQVPRLPPRARQAETQAKNNPTKYVPGSVWGNLEITGVAFYKPVKGTPMRHFPCTCRHCGATWERTRGAFVTAQQEGPEHRCGRCPDARGRRAV